MRGWLCLSLVACGGGVKEEDFRAGFAERSCDLVFECAASDTGTGSMIFFDSPEDCVALFSFAWVQVPEDCDYDGDAAADCLAAMDGASCEDDELSGYDACYEVYTGSDACNIFVSDTTTMTFSTGG